MDLMLGFMNVLSPENLLYCFAGGLLGTLVGVLPGLGPASTIAILLPITVYLDQTGSIIMLAGIYYGAQYGGSTTSILVNMPGEVSSVPTCFDGYPMTKTGRAGQALWIAAVGSFIAGIGGAIAVTLIGPGLAKYALRFGPPEYCALLVLSLTLVVGLAGSGLAIFRALAACLVGMVLSCVGIDPLVGTPRLYFGFPDLMQGLEIIPLTVGLFGIGEIMANAEARTAKIYEGKLGRMMPRGAELWRGLAGSVRGTLVGLPLGVLPGFVPAVSSFIAYDLEKRVSKHPEKFGTGVIEGVAAPEAANNATAQTGFIPLFAFGIPTSASTAIILAALMIYGLQPGPALFDTNKLFIWTVIASMYIGNVMLVVLNLPLVGLWARLSQIPYKYLAPVVLAVCVIGAYSTRNSMFDVGVAVFFGLVGYLMKKVNWPIAPLILGFLLAPMLEVSLSQSLNMGGFAIFFSRPIAAGLIALTVAAMIVSISLLGRVPKEVIESEAEG
ncbi:tripartite tricarboxylate transporter permease [Starkeya sp. ORNL1]|uniref:tripartite tricarboxylate transporter permease n=1 Tax=Starkeya sp. ORNL1 TaxID=2709380 RepID=UPI0014645F07|nr:tripartite tricarboxylate transporter permease [Starkeya sp. ORNL1]QJP14434.1 tripartite tricarboxylate transporter permease [Starkeya sp. ORNL1]